MTTIDNTNPMTAIHTRLLQQVCGIFLYYARAVDCTMQKTVEALNNFLDYCATRLEVTVLYRASNMMLHNHSDAAYLIATGARSRAAEYTYLGNNTNNKQIINIPISIIAKIIKGVMSSAAEAEIGALYMNTRQVLPL